MFTWTNWLIAYICCVGTALLYNRKLKKEGFTGIKTWECFWPPKFVSIFTGFIFGILVPEHVFEQLVLRAYDEDCRKNCINSEDGRCTSCGCDAYLKMMSPFEKDSRDNWDKIIFSKTKYKKLREELPVSIIIKYGKETI